jgi:adenylate kinase family enzyme
MRRVSVITTASGNGGTTFSRKLASRLGVPFHELDALFWKPDWIESSDDEFRALVEPLVATDAWVIDGSYHSKLGDLVFRQADVVVWLDQPMRVWLPRLVRRTFARVLLRQELWGTNRESIWNVFFSRDSLLLFTFRHDRRRRRLYPDRLAAFNLVRLRSSAELERFLSSASEHTTGE